MIINYIHRIGWFVGLILLQVLILNNVHIAGVATPFLYVYFILKFNSGTSRNELMVWGFCMGLAIDIFSNTPGMNAAATVLLAFLRPLFLRLFTPRDTLDSIVPSLKSMGIRRVFIRRAGKRRRRSPARGRESRRRSARDRPRYILRPAARRPTIWRSRARHGSGMGNISSRL